MLVCDQDGVVHWSSWFSRVIVRGPHLGVPHGGEGCIRHSAAELAEQ